MSNNYKIVLEKGEAEKSIFEMTREEILQAGERIFRKVSLEAQKHGQIPAIGQGKKRSYSLSNSIQSVPELFEVVIFRRRIWNDEKEKDKQSYFMMEEFSRVETLNSILCRPRGIYVIQAVIMSNHYPIPIKTRSKNPLIVRRKLRCCGQSFGKVLKNKKEPSTNLAQISKKLSEPLISDKQVAGNII